MSRSRCREKGSTSATLEGGCFLGRRVVEGFEEDKGGPCGVGGGDSLVFAVGELAVEVGLEGPGVKAELLRLGGQMVHHIYLLTLSKPVTIILFGSSQNWP